MQPIGFFMSPYGNDGVLSIESLPDAGYPKSVILGQDVGFMCWPHFEPHRSFVLFELCFQQKLPNTETILSARKIPLAIYVHVDHLVNEDHRQLIADQIIKSLPDFSKSAFGDIYKQNRSKVRTLSILKKSSVIVLGSYRSAESIRELESVRDFVQTMEYSCNLIQDIADVPGMSNADKVEFWTKAARFCVMVDRDPSGHLVEYRILKAQDTIFAMLRPRSGGSTSMIGHEPMVNTNIIKVFEFEHAPLEVLKQATLWAEEVAAKRDAEYKLLRW
jgi:hypothetical protein